MNSVGRALCICYNVRMQRVLVCLHGWGGSKESFQELQAACAYAGITFLVPDLPGFGSEPEPNTPWHNDDYADWVQQWIAAALQVLPSPATSIEIVGHSHGGRIAMKLAYRQSTGSVLPFTITHLHLIAAAGIFHGRHIKRIIGLSLAKTGKLFVSLPGAKFLAPFAKKVLYRLVRVHDYERASPCMQTTMQYVVREDFRPIVPCIQVPADIYWGTNDGMTPVSDAYFLHKYLPRSTLHVYEHARHGIHKTNATEIAAVIIAT